MKPIIQATACYLFKDNQLLTMHRNKNKPDDPMQGYISVPGGKFDDDESPLDCIVREFEEETGLKLIRPKPRGEALFVNPEHNSDFRVYLFTAEEFTGKYEPDHEEGTLEWVSADAWMHLNWRPGDRIYLQDLLWDRYFFAKVEQTKDRIISASIEYR